MSTRKSIHSIDEAVFPSPFTASMTIAEPESGYLQAFTAVE